MKKTFFLFLGAILSFLMLSMIDESDVFLPAVTSLFKKSEPTKFYSVGDDRDFKKTIFAFNDALAKSYLTLDPQHLVSAPIDDNLRSTILEEVNYLKREGRIMDFAVKSISIEGKRILSPMAVQISTRETIEVRYLDAYDKREIIAYSPAEYKMRYDLNGFGSVWKVSSFQVISIEKNKAL